MFNIVDVDAVTPEKSVGNCYWKLQISVNANGNKFTTTSKFPYNESRDFVCCDFETAP